MEIASSCQIINGPLQQIVSLLSHLYEQLCVGREHGNSLILTINGTLQRMVDDVDPLVHLG